MKRSVMIKKINKLLKAWENSKLTYKNKLANQILDLIEKEGMLPPIRTGKVELKQQDDGSLYIELWKWESENERT